MLATIMNEATSTRARRFATYTATTIGGAWVLGKYAVGALVQGAESSRKEAAEKHDLANRFGLALQDAQFTVLALVPTLATQLSEQIDVEARSRELADIAKREREEKNRRAAKEAADEAAKRDDEEQTRSVSAPEPIRSLAEPSTEEAPAPSSEEATASAAAKPKANGHLSTSDDDASPDPASPPPSATRVAQSPPLPPSLNPAAPAFQPRSAPATSPRPTVVEHAAPASAVPTEDFPGLSNGNAHGPEDSSHGEANSPKPNGHMGHESVHDAESLANVGKSWTDIVKENAPSAENGGQEVDAQAGEPERPEAQEEVKLPNGDANGDAAHEKVEVPQETREEDSAPKKSKAELWHEIKTLSFTRLITSIYVLVLLTLQTHVQLALLGRASYVSSLLSSLPPRTPSPPRSKRLHPSPPTEADIDIDVDLERTLYDAKQLPLTAEDEEDERRDVERKYLTFSWWLLHEGWKMVEKRVEGAVEEVVGSLGLKTPLVYGELGALFGEIRRRVERDEDGTLFDFSSALHPPTFELEVQTLIAGGSYVPSPEPSPTASTSHDFPPSTPPRSARNRDPISPALRALLHETCDALDSPDAALVRALSLDALFALLLQRLEPAFTGGASTPRSEERGARFEDVSEKTTRLASLLPLVTKLAGTTGVERGVLSSGVNGNEFVEALEDVRELREFCAVLYGSWDRDDLRTSCAL
ncbi:hypothetical protein JCM10908_005609 [Rhodotorula pacifica]|uniref:Pex3p n=1 Tax=Rhodotorula pacifica TaxID=1495444 RepID=UPI00316F2353